MFFRAACATSILILALPLFGFTRQRLEASRIQHAAQVDKEKNQSDKTRLAPVGSPRPVMPADVEYAWSVQILSSGGLTGAGRGNLTCTSEGTLADESCSKKLLPAAMKELEEIILSFDRSVGSGNYISTVRCFDCYTTTLVLNRREADGSVSTRTFVWDDSTQAQIPTGVAKLYEKLVSLKGCNL